MRGARGSVAGESAAQRENAAALCRRGHPAGLSLPGPGDLEVDADPGEVKAGKKLSPVLLVRGSLWVADGYHPVCASYHA
jgi:hypothetical protein